jgi:signal transduction histidine kinase
VLSNPAFLLERRLAELELQNRRLGALLAAAEAGDGERQRADRRGRLLAGLEDLPASPELTAVLPEIAGRSVPELADWAVVDLADGGEPRRLAVAHRDPARAAMVEALRRLTPGWRGDSSWRHLGIGEGMVVGFDGAEQQVWNATELELHRSLGTRAALLVPVLVEGKVVAVVSFFVTDESGRRYGAGDLALAEELVGRVARAIETARLRRHAEHASAFALALAKSRVCLFEQARWKWIESRLETSVPVPVVAAPERSDETRSPKELAEALAFRDRVIGILGHDLRNPLSAITALARVTMGREDLPGGVRERLAQVDLAAKRSLALIETLLDFSESRFKGVLSTRPVMGDPAAIAARVIEELRAANPERVIALDVARSGPFALDPGRMEQVVSNLVSNALVHGRAETAVEVCVEVSPEEARLSVTNQGPMIPPELIATLFEPFTQGASSRSARPRGLGLGLYIVRHIVAAHGGTISVDSQADQGTTFLVKLPARDLG